NTALSDSVGVGDNASHVVGRLIVQPQTWFSADWRFRIDPDGWDLQRSDVNATAAVAGFNLSATYTFIDEVEQPTSTIPGQEEIILGVSRRISQYWRVAGSLTRDIDAETNRRASGSLVYQDECFTFGLQVEQDLTEDRDREEGTSIFLRIAFRNLGEVPIAISGADLAGGSADN
ncbi:MAG: hypothetical protein GVY28_03655, partial [Alphaproteobacteria bacterium]|nr:hypothetical protein [Alphaproteobacteria bacterium]